MVGVKVGLTPALRHTLPFCLGSALARGFGKPIPEQVMASDTAPPPTLTTCRLSKLVNSHRLGAHPREAFGALRGDRPSTGSLRET